MDSQGAATSLPSRFLGKSAGFISSSLLLGGLLILLTVTVAAQRIAVITPQNNGLSQEFAESLSSALGKSFRRIDPTLAGTAFLSAGSETPFNLTTDESRNIGAAIGCDFFVLVRAEDLNRYSFEKKAYFESFAAVYLVSSRTGRLVDFQLSSFNGFNAVDARRLLLESAPNVAASLAARIASVTQAELGEATTKRPGEIPADGSPAANRFRSPLPYKRLSPKYTATANLYGIAATVDIEVDIDEKGQILRTEIVRWAGFGLDESVENAVKSMNWRPAERAGKPEPVRFLLRYNFKKVEKED